jgi:hypothetical protein
VLRSLEWIYGGEIEGVVAALQHHGLAVTPGITTGRVRTRLVAFGRSTHSDLHTISLSHVVQQMVEFMACFDDVLRPANFKDPAPALLRLLGKIGFSIEKD